MFNITLLDKKPLCDCSQQFLQGVRYFSEKHFAIIACLLLYCFMHFFQKRLIGEGTPNKRYYVFKDLLLITGIVLAIVTYIQGAIIT